MVEIMDERVECAHTLFDAGGQPAPLDRRKHPRDDVEGNEALGGLVVAIDREGDALPPEQPFGLPQRPFDVLRPEGLEPLFDQ